MAKEIEEARIEAVRRYLSGEDADEIANSLGFRRRWLFKWVKRYREGRETWFKEKSKAPHRLPRKTNPDIEHLVLEVRERLESTKYSQIGASAIAWELKKLGVNPIPYPWTINRILCRYGKVRKRMRYEPKGTPYPYFPREAPNDLQQGDFLGPRYIKGDGRFYSLNVMDVARHKVALSPIRTKQDTSVVSSLILIWSRLGIPKYFQMDNELVFRGSNRYPRSFGEVIRLCLSLGVEPVFIPIGEPWRNPEIEKFQDTFDKKFFRAQEFSGFVELYQEAKAFEDFHNEYHRYSCLGGRTPAEVEKNLSFELRLPPVSFKVPRQRPDKGKIHLVRLIRSDCTLDVFSERFKVPAELTYQYVTATIYVKDQKLEVVHDGEVICIFDYLIP